MHVFSLLISQYLMKYLISLSELLPRSFGVSQVMVTADVSCNGFKVAFAFSGFDISAISEKKNYWFRYT